MVQALDREAGKKQLRVAVVHDWLPVYAGAERVLEQILKVYPHADIYSLIDLIPEGKRGFLQDKPVHTSFLQKWKWVRKRYRSFLPLMPLAIEQFDLSSYDLVISSSYAVAKGVITGPDQLHVCYCHSPMRYAWDLQHQYLQTAKLDKGIKSWMARMTLHYLRMWDALSQNRVDHFIANSEFIGRRIQKNYRRPSAVIHPPVAVEDFPLCEKKEDYYVTVSRLVPYKMVGLVVEAFSRMPHLELRVVGEGPEFERIRAKAGPNVKMLGYQSGAEVRKQMQEAKAFVFAGEEDFGIAAVEAQACGTPVVAYGKGGVCETVVDGKTGLFFPEQTPEAIIDAITEFEIGSHDFAPAKIREHAMQFSAARFRQEFAREVESRWQHFSSALGPAAQRRRTTSSGVPTLLQDILADAALTSQRLDAELECES